MNEQQVKADAAKHYEGYYTDYADGIRDCLDDKLAMITGSDRYNQGYSDQYTLEQVISK